MHPTRNDQQPTAHCDRLGDRPAAIRALTRRLRRASGDAGQAALVMVVALSVLLVTIGAMMVQQTVQSAPLLQSDTVQHYAYRALEAGMNTYQSIVNTNPNLANCNTSTNGDAYCQGARYQTWNLVADTDGAGEVPEYYLFDNPQPQFNADGSLASLQVQIVGVAGTANHYAYQSAIANLAPVNGFLNVVWWTDYEASEPGVDNPDYQSGNVCQYDWQTNYQGAGPNCTAVSFGPYDTINGPVFSNDSIYVSKGPNFGVAAPWASVKTEDPKCLFVDPTCPLTTSTDVGHYAASPASADNQPHETAPADDSQLEQVAAIAAPNNGCIYYGPTQITLNGSTMTVKSPDTVTPSTNCPANGATGNLPPNGVVYVDNAVATKVNPSSQIVAGANPFDDSAQSGKYAQTCGDYTTNGVTEPCYFGFTGSSTEDTEGDAFVSGSLATGGGSFGDLTIGSANDIIIDGSLTYSDCTKWVGTAHESACSYNTNGKNDVLGLIANHYVEVDHPIFPTTVKVGNTTYPQYSLLPVCGSSTATSLGLTAPLCQPVDGSNNITIDATILALNQSFGADNYAAGGVLGNIILYGSVQQEARGAVALIGTSGFGKYYTWDPRLELVSPPSYLNPGTASYVLDSSAISSSASCPALKNVYGTPGTTTCPAVP